MTRLTYTHRRGAWLGDTPWIAAPAFDWNRIELFVVHWPGSDSSIDGDPGEYASQLDDWLRAVQRSYLNRNGGDGYNVGYNSGGDWLGGTWELRGDQFKCAANAGLNDLAFAHLVFTDLDGRITSEAIDGVRRMWQQVKAIRPNVRMIGHGQGPALFPDRDPTPTSCPGPLQRLIDDGTFTRAIGTTPPPAPAGQYLVVSGDGWYRISYKLGVTARRLAAANGRTLDYVLHPGDRIRVPAPERSYTVRPNEGYWSVATGLQLSTTATTYGQLSLQAQHKYGRVTLRAGDVLTA